MVITERALTQRRQGAKKASRPFDFASFAALRETLSLSLLRRLKNRDAFHFNLGGIFQETLNLNQHHRRKMLAHAGTISFADFLHVGAILVLIGYVDD